MGFEKRYKQLGMDRSIRRRDFLNGMAIAVGTTMSRKLLPGFEWMADESGLFPQDKPGYYPPALTGMRGSHDGAFEAAHAARDGKATAFPPSALETGEAFDLIVVGGGISGLAAAY